MKKFVIFIRSLIFNMYFMLWNLIASIIFLPLLFILPAKQLTLIVGKTWAVVSLFGLEKICGIKHEIRGTLNLPVEPCIIAAKHQSAWETMIFYYLTKYPSFVLKKELVSIPIYGKYLKSMGSIIVDRQAGASALKKIVHDGRNRLENGRTVIIFPEGTRTKAGEKGIYHPGIAALYSRCEAKIIPVALNSGKFWGRNSFLKHPGKIILEFMPAIEQGLRRDQFMERLESSIENKTNKLLAEKQAA